MSGPIADSGTSSGLLSALPPLPGQAPGDEWSLPGSGYFKKDGTKYQQHWHPGNFPGVVELAWITYQRHVFGVDHVALFRHEHDPDDEDAQDTSCKHVDEDNCPLYKTAIAVLFRLGVPPPKTATQPCPVFPDFVERDDATLAVDQAQTDSPAAGTDPPPDAGRQVQVPTDDA